MVLYDDLKCYSMFKADPPQTLLEWELQGELALRLHMTDDAIKCFAFTAKNRYSCRLWLKLLQLYMKENNISYALDCCEQLVGVFDRWKCGELLVSVFEKIDLIEISASYVSRFFSIVLFIYKFWQRKS